MPRKPAPKTVLTKKPKATPPPPVASSVGVSTLPPKKRWRGLIHMPEFYILFFAFVISISLSLYFLFRPPQKTVIRQDVVRTKPLDTSRWAMYNGRFFTFKYPPEWKITEATLVSTPRQSLFKTCDFYLTSEKYPEVIIAVDITEPQGRYCWANGTFTDTTERTISVFPTVNTTTLRKWQYDRVWNGDYFQSYHFIGTSQDVTFGLINQEANKKNAELAFDQILSTFTFVIVADDN